jgi:hypothetical protein
MSVKLVSGKICLGRSYYFEKQLSILSFLRQSLFLEIDLSIASIAFRTKPNIY